MRKRNSNFKKKAFAIVNANNLGEIFKIKKEIFDFSKKELNLKKIKIDDFFNYFHLLKLEKLRLNNYRLKLIKFLSGKKEFKKKIFNAFSLELRRILGEDIAVQKSLNVVIHQPNNLDISPIHRDGPENSPYEIVLWLPLVDCFKTKSIYLLDKKNTEKNLRLLDSNKKSDSQTLKNRLVKLGKLPNIKFGQAVVFWSCLLHSVPENVENETRWTFNLRLKNAFTPYGKKGFLDYFEILRESELTTLGLDFEKKNY